MEIRPAQVHTYQLLKRVLERQVVTPEIKDTVSISPETIARKVPTLLDSIHHLPERISLATALSGSVISILSGPVGWALGGATAVAVPTAVLIRRRLNAAAEAESSSGARPAAGQSAGE